MTGFGETVTSPSHYRWALTEILFPSLEPKAGYMQPCLLPAFLDAACLLPWSSPDPFPASHVSLIKQATTANLW